MSNTTASKTSARKTANKGNAAMANRIVWKRNKSGTEYADANGAHIAQAEELRATGNALTSLTLNVIAGKVSPAIQRAVDNQKLEGVLPGESMKNQRAALKHLMTIPATDIEAAWNKYAESAERVTPPTLQRLHKLTKPEKSNGGGVPWKQYGEAIIEAHKAGNTEGVKKLIEQMAADNAGGEKAETEPAH